MTMKKSNDSDCKEYNNLKYKTMIMTGNTIDTKIENQANRETIDSFLTKEMNQHKKQSWTRLTKTEKTNKIKQYIETIIKQDFELTNDECQSAYNYICSLLERNKLIKNTELDYNEEEGNINNIYIICFNKIQRKFVLNKNFKTSSLKKKQNINKKKTVKSVKNVHNDNKIENELKH